MNDVLKLDRLPGHVAVVTIDRPEKRNAMNPQFFSELLAVCDEIDADDSVRCAVITGAGDAFSAGGDIASFRDLTTMSQQRRHLRLVFDAFHAVERAATPVIAAVNGIAYGGGTELTLSCDVAIASTAARFAFKEATVGLTPGYGVLRGPEIIGRAWTKWLALSAEAIDAETALACGLVQQVVGPDRLLDTAISFAETIASRAPLGVQVGKRLINRTVTSPGISESIEATALLFSTDDHREGTQAFVDKRPPHFEGR